MRNAIALGSMLLGWAVAGCGVPSEERPSEPESLPQGLSVLESSESSIALAYREADVVIYMQAVRGKLAPDVYQTNPDEPVFEVDARFDADNGRTFYSRKGGDEWVEPSWAEDFERQNHLPPVLVSNEALFDMAAEAAEQLEVVVPKSVQPVQATAIEPMVRSLRDFGLAAPSTFAQQKQRRIEMQIREGLSADQAVRGEVPYGSAGPEDATHEFGANYYYISVHDECIVPVLWWCEGYHSATRLYQWLGYWSWVHDSCNHGSCAGSMGQKCFLEYYEAVEDYKPAWTLQSCAGPYDWASNDTHNCHDDTRLQMNNFVYGSYNNGWQGWCADGDSGTDISNGVNDQGGSPNCDASTNYGYNHPSWKPNASVGSGYICTPSGDRLCTNEVLYAGQSRTSSDGRFTFVYQGDGNLVLYRLSNWYPMWSAASNSAAGHAAMQGDGNLVTYTNTGVATWASYSSGQNLYLTVQNDGNVVVYDPWGNPRWSTGTGGN